MSRLDYITIAIVAACILAIIFLIYKMTDLFNEEPGQDKIENTVDQVETEDSLYDYKLEDEKTDGDNTEAESATDNTKAPASAEDTGTPDQNTTAKEETDRMEDKTETRPAKTGTSGKFMVISGTYTKKDLARKQVAKLRSLGYDNASMEIFDRGKYAVVLADRFNNMASAERLVKDLKAEGINSYVKIKEGM